MPAVSSRTDERSKQALLHGLPSEDQLDDTEPQRTASLHEVASQFCWMGWIALPDVYIGLFQSVSLSCSAIKSLNACRMLGAGVPLIPIGWVITFVPVHVAVKVFPA